MDVKSVTLSVYMISSPAALEDMPFNLAGTRRGFKVILKYIYEMMLGESENQMNLSLNTKSAQAGAKYPIVCWGRQFSWHSERVRLPRLFSYQEVLTITCFP